ncbi:hypothetical protein [Pseudomonas sp. W03]|uniref:hypothetical protein n=1 Tax=Pseudomonas sp. W03 TaxID=3090666 RepID=UPI003A4DF4D6
MSRHKKVVSLLEKNLRYLESVGVDSSLVCDYKSLLAYLKSRSLVEVLHILGDANIKDNPVERRALDVDRIERMSPDEIAERIRSPKTTRLMMEKIASTRFGITRGGLSSLRSRDALKEKLESMLRNELAHRAITNVALGNVVDEAERKRED